MKTMYFIFDWNYTSL